MSTDLLSHVRQAIGPAYTLHRELGAGGTSVVYLADDRKHGRSVALKVLLPEVASTIGAERFLREIRLAARLTHPHILPVLDSGDVDGLPFYVMPFIDGENLRSRMMREGRMTPTHAVALAREVADALEYAHAAGIVHRDIKPENILLMGDHAVVADFGIARAVRVAATEPPITSSGLAVGTPAYMSPEQAAGEPIVDGRSDLYSLAVVLFEMLAGVTPFAGPSVQVVIARRFTEIAPRLCEVRDDVPMHIDEAVAVALSLEPSSRQASVGEFSRALLGEPAGSQRPSMYSPAVGTESVRPGTVETSVPSIAIVPFENLSADPENEYFSDGITEEIIGALSRLRNLRVAARASSFAFKGRREDVRAIGDQLHVGTILGGSVRRSGRRVRVNCELVDVRTGAALWSERFDRELDDVFAIQDDIARAITETLKVALLGDSSGALVVAPTPSAAAYEAYLKGRFCWNKRTEEGLRRAARYFTEAVEADGDFALAYAGRADTLAVLGIYGAEIPGDVMPMAKQAAQKALELNPTLAEAQTSLGVVRAAFDWDWAGAGDAFRRAISISPRYPTAHHWYAVNYLAPQRLFNEAQREIDRAHGLDPLSLVISASVGVVRYFAGDYAGAVDEQTRTLEIDSGFAMSHYFLAMACRERGEMSRAIAEFERAMRLSDRTPEMVAGLAQAHARGGALETARGLLDELTARKGDRYVAPSLFAQVHLALDNRAEAFEWLDLAAETHDADLIFVGLRPAYDVLRGDRRFEALKTKIGLPG